MSERRTLALAAGITGAAVPAFVAIFTLWGRAGLSEAAAQDAVRVGAFASRHPALYAALPVTGVVMHLAALVLVLGLHRRLVATSPLWAGVGSFLGLWWVGADLLQNLMHYGLFLGGTPAELLPAANRVVDSLWHAGHAGGGLWILVLAGTGGALFGRGYRACCALVGAVFALHPFVFPLAPWWFGLELAAVPVWAAWTALAIARSPAFGARAAVMAPRPTPALT